MTGRLLSDPGLPASSATESYWQEPQNTQLRNRQSRCLPDQQDIVIIGSGITGASVAWHLLKGVVTDKITVLDAREICSGATGRNGGRVNCTAVQDYAKYSTLLGPENAKRIVRFELAHLDAIFEAVDSLGPEVVRKSELRRVEAIAALFEDEAVDSMRNMLFRFEAAFPDMVGRWKVLGQEETARVSKSWGEFS